MTNFEVRFSVDDVVQFTLERASLSGDDLEIFQYFEGHAIRSPLQCAMDRAGILVIPGNLRLQNIMDRAYFHCLELIIDGIGQQFNRITKHILHKTVESMEIKETAEYFVKDFLSLAGYLPCSEKFVAVGDVSKRQQKESDILPSCLKAGASL